MNCYNCGFNNPDDALFCAGCGTRLERRSEQQSAPRFESEELEREYMGYTAHVPETAGTPELAPRPGDPSKDWAGVTGFVMGIVSLVATPLLNILGIPGLIISIIGMGGRKRGLSIAGIILSVIGMLVGIAFLGIIAAAIIGFSQLTPAELHEFETYLEGFSGVSAMLLPFIR